MNKSASVRPKKRFTRPVKPSTQRSAGAERETAKPNLPKSDGVCHIHKVPHEVLMYIFSYLGSCELVSCARVCHFWQNLSNDNLLWRRQYEKIRTTLLQNKPVDNTVQEKPTLYWKKLCLTHSVEFRNRRAFRRQSRSDPFTQLPIDTVKKLEEIGVVYTLDIVDGRGTHHYLKSDDCFYHRIAATNRWYSNLPPLESMKKIRILAFNPVFYESNGSASKNSPCQRSLLEDYGVFNNKDLQKCTSHADNMVTHYLYKPGLVIGMFTAGGGLAYIAVNTPLYELVRRCLKGTNTDVYKVPNIPIQRYAELDTQYGLHGYSAVCVIRHHRKESWSSQKRDLLISKSSGISDAHLNLSWIDPNKQHEHEKISEQLELLYRAGTFKNKTPDMCCVELILYHEDRLIWTFSEHVIIQPASSNDVSYDYNDSQRFLLQYSEVGKGKLSLYINKSRADNTITELNIGVSLGLINRICNTTH